MIWQELLKQNHKNALTCNLELSKQRQSQQRNKSYKKEPNEDYRTKTTGTATKTQWWVL